MRKITLLDGSCGSALWELADRSDIPKDPVWRYSIEHPDLVLKLHKDYIDAGSDMIQTNTFCVNRPVVSKSSEYSVEALVKSSVEIAREAVKGTGVGVYLSTGPLDELLEPYGDLEEDECSGIYDEIFSAAAGAGVDMIMLETFMDLRMIRLAAESALKYDIPVSCSLSFFAKHRTMMGDSIPQICETFNPMGVSALGMNCSFGPAEGLEIIRDYRNYTDLPLYFKPNAGTGESFGVEDFAANVAPSLEFVSYVGGCCGTGAEYISALRNLVDKVEK